MAQYTLFPSFVQVYYHSQYGPHVMTLPTLQWSPGAGQGAFETWDLASISADTMIEAFVTAWAELFTDDSEFDYYAIWNYPDEDSLPVQVAYNTLAIPGGQVAATQNTKAVELTVTWACSGGFILKTVGLDAIGSANFQKVGVTGILALIPDIVAEVTGSGNGWASRAGTQPIFGKQIAYTLNEKLRRSYHEN